MCACMAVCTILFFHPLSLSLVTYFAYDFLTNDVDVVVGVDVAGILDVVDVVDIVVVGASADYIDVVGIGVVGIAGCDMYVAGNCVGSIVGVVVGMLCYLMVYGVSELYFGELMAEMVIRRLVE